MSDAENKGLRPAEEELSKVDDSGKVARQIDIACGLAEESANHIFAQFGSTLDRSDRIKVLAAFRRKLIPTRKRGRRPKERITAAFHDWKNGVRGVELYRKHIPAWERHGYWRRKAECRSLMDAIHMRVRRERLRRSSTIGNKEAEQICGSTNSSEGKK